MEVPRVCVLTSGARTAHNRGARNEHVNCDYNDDDDDVKNETLLVSDEYI